MPSTGNDNESKIIELDGRGTINAIVFAEDGKQIWSGGDEGVLRRWWVDDGGEIGEAIPAGGKIVSAALSPDRKWMVCGLHGSKSNVKVWDAKTQEIVWDNRSLGHTDAVTSVDISFDSTRLATGSNDKRTFIWSLPPGRRPEVQFRHDNAVVAVRFSPKGERIAMAIAHKSICIYDSTDRRPLLNIPCPFHTNLASPLAWSADGLRLYAASYTKIHLFDTSSGSLQTEWLASGGSSPGCIVLSRNQKFIAIVADRSLSFWDTATREKIGPVVDYATKICSLVLSHDDDIVVTGEQRGKITLRGLPDKVLPYSYVPVDSTSFASSHLLTLMDIGGAASESWRHGNFTRAEQHLTQEILHSPNPSSRARALAHRAFVRSRSKQYITAIEDAKKSLEVQRSVIGHIALAVAHVGSGEHDSAIHAFDYVFTDGLSTERNLLLLIKTIVLFECGEREVAISSVDELIDRVHDKSVYITVRAQMLFLLGRMSLENKDYVRAGDLLGRAREAIPFQKRPHLTVISLIFGWDFDGFDPAMQQHLQQCTRFFESAGDSALQSNHPEQANELYSSALSLIPSNPARLLIKRSNVRAILKLWEEALRDADAAIDANPQSPWGYERKHAALHNLQCYEEAVGAYTHMFFLMETSHDQKTRQRCKNYISPDQLEMAISNVAHEVSKTCPLVLIDVKTGRLCDESERMDTFKREMQFMELFSSMTRKVEDARIHRVVAKYFRYVTFSHFWEGREPSYQDVKSVHSVSKLSPSPLNNKLCKFCEVVCADEYRWAWSDTCCIDKTTSTVLNQSLTMMYGWYEASAATFVFLADVDSLRGINSLSGSKWMTRAWTSQELLAPTVIRFYDCNWKPYLGDTRVNHKESPEIMRELANAIGITRETIKAFNPDNLTVREKLRLASSRNAMKEEDVAYSLIGIFKSDILPHYGEGAAALGHLQEEIVSRSGEVTVFAWTGKSSSYNSCLPATLSVYNQTPRAPPTFTDVEMDQHVAALKYSVSPADVMLVHHQITSLPPARFSHRRLHLPCIIFTVKRFRLQSFESDYENNYRARVPGIGHVTFRTSDRLSVEEPRKFIFVHPWIRDLRDPLDGGSASDADGSSSESSSDEDTQGAFVPVPRRPPPAVRAARVDDYTRALRLLVHLKRPFQALLLHQQPDGEFRRVASEYEIVVPGLDPNINLNSDIRVDVVDIL